MSTSAFKGRLGFGAMRLPMVDSEPDYELCNQMLDCFLGAGLNYFDTAHVYLGGKSEATLRESFAGCHSHESFFLVDKLTHGTFKNPETIRKVFQEELDAYGVECFDLLLAHAVNSGHYGMCTRQASSRRPRSSWPTAAPRSVVALCVSRMAIPAQRALERRFVERYHKKS